MSNAEKIKLALGVISGRIDINRIDDMDDWSDLGYDPYRFNACGGRPSINEVKSKAEDIILGVLLEGRCLIK